ncbi:MAG: NAD(P)H-hydrate epimerase, partial [Chloroflexi bacterium]|nr:NAD(P)H-hydrate epimerase [Chloroflexota bacterium]
MRVVTVSEMRLVEDRAIEAGVSVEGLMESAGRAVAVAVRGEMTGAVAGRHVLILVGPGNNGGDGLVAARYLRRWGAEVHVHAPVGRRPTDRLWAEATAAGYAVASEAIDPSVSRLRMDTTRAEVIVDALLGTGHTRPLDGQIAIALQTVDGVLRGGTPPHARIVAVDVPTGVNADTGGVDPLTVPADLTVVLGILKRGHLTDVAASVCGRLTVVDIGIPPHLDDGIGIRLINAASVRAMLPDRAIGGHKGTFGRVLIVGGSRQYMGAPVLAARGAARIGAGLVTIAAPASISDHIATMMPEATHHPMRERGLADDDLTQTPGIADVAGASTAKLIGPGLGRGARARRLVSDGVMGLRPSAFASLVLDADALGILAELPDWALRLPSPTILTPHPGEMARLCGASTDEIQADRLGI